MECSNILLPSNLFGDLPILKIRCTVRLRSNMLAGSYLGSAWRGLIGWEMKKHICPFDVRANCNSCVIKEHCPYYLLLEKKTSFPGLYNSPRGYILYSSPLDSDNCVFLDISLFGSCTKLLALIVKCVLSGQKTGLGAMREAYDLRALEQILPDGSHVPIDFGQDQTPVTLETATLKEWLNSMDACRDSRMIIHLITPLRLRKQGKYLGDFELEFFLCCVARRLEALNCIFNNDKPIGKDVWSALKRRFRGSEDTKSNVKWVDFGRYSSRQRAHILLGGLVGSVEMSEIDSLHQRWLRAASIVHVGKGAAMGLGKIVITNGKTGR